MSMDAWLRPVCVEWSGIHILGDQSLSRPSSVGLDTGCGHQQTHIRVTENARGLPLRVTFLERL